jgi:hypothetical protein
MGALMRARAVREALGISAWDLREMVACGTLEAVFPVGRWRGQSAVGSRQLAVGSKQKTKRRWERRGRLAGEKVPYYRRSQVEDLQRGRGEI